MKAEKGIASIIIAALLMKFFHIPFAGPLLVISLGSLSLLYSPLGINVINEESTKKNLTLSIVGGLLLFSVPIGILFKLMYWPFASQMLMMGVVTSTILFVIIIATQKKNPSSNELSNNSEYWSGKNLLTEKVEEEKNDPFYKNMFIRTSILSFFAILLFFTPNSTLIAIQHRDDPEMVRLKTQYFEHPENAEYRRQYEEYSFGKNPKRN